MKKYSYLALGDSYTIGEQVRINASFPYQLVYLMRQQGYAFEAPEIIATTGFTTDELNTAIDNTATLQHYDFVTLLIGVNNQYRGRTTENFLPEFELLLQRAIRFAGDNTNRVFVLSIPDWGVTPFAEGRNRQQIALEIDAYNNVCKNIAARYNVTFIDITITQRADGNDLSFLAADQLHPSAKEYAKWAGALSAAMVKALD